MSMFFEFIRRIGLVLCVKLNVPLPTKYTMHLHFMLLVFRAYERQTHTKTGTITCQMKKILLNLLYLHLI